MSTDKVVYQGTVSIDGTNHRGDWCKFDLSLLVRYDSEEYRVLSSLRKVSFNKVVAVTITVRDR